MLFSFTKQRLAQIPMIFLFVHLSVSRPLPASCQNLKIECLEVKIQSILSASPTESFHYQGKKPHRRAHPQESGGGYGLSRLTSLLQELPTNFGELSNDELSGLGSRATLEWLLDQGLHNYSEKASSIE